MVKHLEIKVYGQVQGVGFRQTVKEKAESLNLVGFTRNIPNGSVYIEIEGDEDRLNQFVAWCREGNEAAVIGKVDIREGKVKGFPHFLVLASLFHPKE